MFSHPGMRAKAREEGDGSPGSFRRGRRCFRFVFLTAGVLAFGALVGSPAVAAELDVEILPLVARPRTGGPLPVEVRLKCNRMALLEGQLEVEYRDGNEVVGRYRTPDLALTTGERNLRLLLPAPPAVYGGEIGLACRFLSAGQRWEWPVQPVLMPLPPQRALVLAICEGAGSTAYRRGAVEQGLRLDRFEPGLAADIQKRRLVTALTRPTPDDMPSLPMAYCAYDAVALIKGGLAGLRERQREALRRWVEAGGSLFVSVEERATPEQIEFLNVLAGTARFSQDSGGAISPSGLTSLRSGLGRVVVAGTEGPSHMERDTQDWRKAVGFLWKLRARQVDDIVRTGYWRAGNSNDTSGLSVRERHRRGIVEDGSSGLPVLGARLAPFSGELSQAMMPRQAKMIPFSLILGLLVVFLVLIGPGDWWLLGLLKRRRYTWILLPVLTCGFALAMVRLADHYLGKTDRRCALTVVDIGRDGQALRTDRYMVSFSGRDQKAIQACRDSLWARMDVGNFDDYAYYGGMRGGRRQEGKGPCEVEGFLPGRFSVSRNLSQWKPELTRMLALEGGEAPLPAFKWEVAERYLRGGGARSGVNLAELQGGKGSFQSDVYIFRGEQVEGQYITREHALASVVKGLCAPQQAGVFSLFSQLSPSGGASGEDTLVASDEDGRYLVAVVTRSGDEIVLQRRFYDIR